MKSMIKMFKVLLGGILLLAFALAGQAGAQTWTQLSPAGGPPIDRGTSAVLDTATNRMVIFGGQSGDAAFVPTMLNDLWVLTSADGLGGTPT